jgi:hypothetical protein
MKDGEEGATFSSCLEIVEVAVNKHGKPITSGVLVPVDAKDLPPVEKKPKAKERRISDAEKIAELVILRPSLALARSLRPRTTPRTTQRPSPRRGGASMLMSAASAPGANGQRSAPSSATPASSSQTASSAHGKASIG